jgi:hypothetical protein
VAAPWAGNSHAYRDLVVLGTTVTKRISLIVTNDTDIEAAMVDHSIAFRSAPATTISIFDVGGAISVGQSRDACGFNEQTWIESVDCFECVTRELAADVSL